MSTSPHQAPPYSASHQSLAPASALHSTSSQHCLRTSTSSSIVTCVTDLLTVCRLHDRYQLDSVRSTLPAHLDRLDSMTTVLSSTDRYGDRFACNSTFTGINAQRCCRCYIHSYPSDTITTYPADAMLCDSVHSHWPNLPTFDLRDYLDHPRSPRVLTPHVPLPELNADSVWSAELFQLTEMAGKSEFAKSVLGTGELVTLVIVIAITGNESVTVDAVRALKLLCVSPVHAHGVSFIHSNSVHSTLLSCMSGGQVSEVNHEIVNDRLVSKTVHEIVNEVSRPACIVIESIVMSIASFPIPDPVSFLVPVPGPVPVPVPTTGEQLVQLMEQLIMEQLIVVEQHAAGRAPNAHAVGTIFDGRAKSAHGAWEDHGLAPIASTFVPDPLHHTSLLCCTWPPTYPPHTCDTWHHDTLLPYAERILTYSDRYNDSTHDLLYYRTHWRDSCRRPRNVERHSSLQCNLREWHTRADISLIDFNDMAPTRQRRGIYVDYYILSCKIAIVTAGCMLVMHASKRWVYAVLISGAERQHHPMPRYRCRCCPHVSRHTMIMLALIVIFMNPARAADPTDLLSSDDLSDTLIGMIHYHGIAHVMSAVAAALPIAASLPDAHDCRSRSASSHTAILTAIATIAAFAATLASSPAEPSDADSHEHDHETPSWLLDAADTLERTSDRSGSDSDDDSIDDSHVNKPETSITPNPPNTTVIDQKYRGVTTHLNSGVLRGVMPDSTLDPRTKFMWN